MGMEIFGIGTDIIECPRIGKMIEHHGELFLRRVYAGARFATVRLESTQLNISPGAGLPRRPS